MREVAFIKQNKEKWLEFEQAIFSKAKKNPDDLASLYIQLVNDLAYAQSFYPKSKSVVYLNNLAAVIYQKIYKTKREEKNRLIHFFKTEVPLIAYQNRRYILYAFLLFIIFTAIGVFSAANDDSFVRLILGDAYVNETLQNIKEGNPVAIYKSSEGWSSAIGITLHNLQVSAVEFALGLLGGFGTAWALFENSIMLGAFQYFFYNQDVFWASVRGIWIHGAMEIFSLVICAASGFIFGAGLLFPKTYSRIESLKTGFKNGIKIWISTLPFLFFAGMLEGFVTRYSKEMPMVLNIFIILSTLSLISWYYLIYPFVVHYKMKKALNSL